MNSADNFSGLETRAEIFRIARLCAPVFDSLGRITFEGDPVSELHRHRWRDAVFLPCLVPAIHASYSAARRGFRELVAVDHNLNAQLAGPLAKNSRATGRQIALSAKAPVGETALERYLPAVERGESPGHMAVVFTARAAAFHQPLPLVVVAIVFLEFRASSIGDLWPAIEDCIRQIPLAENGLRAA
jgi:hypothetical protein